ncbi:OLC1v1033671C1 [Oldenlandia corymbosa var. corymbosa]|uniref:OLC1v1033671C1 n=1 Tax=Oldenlandia corymbosa var. corymbosa TaxID=529605 RepID=A0AAV1CQ69_OLDCO|nr:OLC1v1033671C1 [Oldenlandia corymbosa var. corymbosa]
MTSNRNSCNNLSQSNEGRKKRAAVLICIFEDPNGELKVILTKRSMNLSTHPGEVVLPGGKTDEALDADDIATALREAKEEIGLAPNLVKVITALEPFVSFHLLTVVPVVGFLTGIDDFKPVLNPHEVDAIYYLPLEMFIKEDSTHYLCQAKEWEGCKYISHVFRFNPAAVSEVRSEPVHDQAKDGGSLQIGGLTASALIRASSLIFRRPPPFTQLLPDFTQLQRSLNPAEFL